MFVYALFEGLKLNSTSDILLYMKVYKLYRFVKQDKSKNQLFALVKITRLVVSRNVEEKMFSFH